MLYLIHSRGACHVREDHAVAELARMQWTRNFCSADTCKAIQHRGNNKYQSERSLRAAKRDYEADHPQVKSHRVSSGRTLCKVVSLERTVRGKKEEGAIDGTMPVWSQSSGASAYTSGTTFPLAFNRLHLLQLILLNFSMLSGLFVFFLMCITYSAAYVPVSVMCVGWRNWNNLICSL